MTFAVAIVPPWYHLVPPSPVPWVLEQELGQGVSAQNAVDPLATFTL